MRFSKIYFILAFLISVKLFATAQAPDYLIIGKDTLSIQSNPLQEYFEAHPIPKNLITIISSGNWRGYIAYFQFLDGKLVVENIYKEEAKENDKAQTDFVLTSIYKEVFGDNKNFECNFYSGLLICPSGKMLQYVHMGYSSLFENYTLIELKDGINIKSKKITGEEFMDFKKKYFKYYKKTDEYKQKAKEFKEMTADQDKVLNELMSEKSNNNKENKYLKQKEADYKADKQVESFMFIFLNDYMKTIEIPLN
ncbi:hypothetical protein [Flavobacterium reichenbachii]|uniref:Uncharacterized protein n=1 Tax=Flavobacterium reichenbachii TaxID=362418 RepID=A0A085ZL66_9FLAO|nr:hypothetical protein [Flavobacterium reichenbachii]KFF05180.1 hypothetical protein IW19_06375 [Flavobacterium reichenbachii]OXB16156.1 hypothetical protein B0A68_07780 [Flavobacterium reichenbachii]